MTTCPFCGKQFNYLEAMMDDEWRHIIKMLPEFDGHGRLIFEYIELFGVTPLRMKSKKIFRLLRQVKEFFEKEEFPYRKKRYRISRAGIIQALQVTCNKHFSTPLEDHNYLKKVMITVSEKEAKEKSIADEKALRKKEERIRDLGKSDDEEGEYITYTEWINKGGKRNDDN